MRIAAISLALLSGLAAPVAAAPLLINTIGQVHYENGDPLGTGASTLGLTMFTTVQVPSAGTPVAPVSTNYTDLGGFLELTDLAAPVLTFEVLPNGIDPSLTIDLIDDYDLSGVTDPRDLAQLAAAYPGLALATYDLAQIVFFDGAGTIGGLLVFGDATWFNGGVAAFTEIAPDWAVYSFYNSQDGYAIAEAQSFEILSDVPLPAPAALLGAGLLGLGIVRRRSTVS